MPKPLLLYRNLQVSAQRELDRLAPDAHLTAVIEHDDDQIEWGDDGVGRAPWRCGILKPSADFPIGDLRSRLNAAMASTQATYSLGFNAEEHD